MANEEHLWRIRQGVEVWNRWREKNPKIKIDLSQADFNSAKLRGANLTYVNLYKTIFSNADLREADLRWADLRGTNLKGTDLSKANLAGQDLRGQDLSETTLCETNLYKVNLVGQDLSGKDLRKTVFRGANLSEANLSRADLKGASLEYLDLRGKDFSFTDLREANLSGISLKGANLHKANLEEQTLIHVDLSDANLTETNLYKANLGSANLTWANLQGTNLQGTNLRGLDLSGRDLSGANLEDQDLSGKDLSETILVNVSFKAARLMEVKLNGANMTGAHLWETQRAGWSIKGVICDWAYWDKEGKEKTEYAPGEFERLFADQTKIKLLYKDGITPLEIATLPALIQHLEETKGCALRFISITESASGAVVELAIENTDNQSPEEVKQLQSQLQASAQEKVKYQRLALSEKKARLQLEGSLQESRRMVNELFHNQKSNYYLTSGRDIHMSEDKGDTINISGGQQGAVGRNAHAHDMTFNQTINQGGEGIDLVALASELATLRIAIAKLQDSSPQAMIAAGEIAKAEFAAGEKDESKVMEHLKTAGKWAFDTATKIGTSVAAEVIKKSMGM